MLLKLMLVLVVCTVPPVLSFRNIDSIAKPPRHAHPMIKQMLEVSNSYRGQQGRKLHRISPELTAAAQNHADYMARTGVFSHQANRGLLARVQDAGYPGMVRENIAMGYPSVNEVFAGWRNSSGHWASMISQETEDAGFGYAVSSRGEAYWVAVYGDAE